MISAMTNVEIVYRKSSLIIEPFNDSTLDKLHIKHLPTWTDFMGAKDLYLSSRQCQQIQVKSIAYLMLPNYILLRTQ